MTKEVFLDLNDGIDCQNFPVYGSMAKTRRRVDIGLISRIPGHSPDKDGLDVKILDPDRAHEPIAFFDYQGMEIYWEDEEKRLLMDHHDEETLDVLSEARHFGIIFPQNFLSADALTFSDLLQDGQGPDAYANATRKLVQILFHLLSRDNIELCWEGGLPGEVVNVAQPEEGEEEEEEEEEELEEEAEDGPKRKKSQRGKKKKKKTKEVECLKVPTQEIAYTGLNGLLKPHSIKGRPNSQQFAVVSEDDTERIFNRFAIDIITVPKEEIERRVDRAVYWEDENFYETETELYVLVFTLYDPRLSISKGFKRLMARNSEVRKRQLDKIRDKQATGDNRTNPVVASDDFKHLESNVRYVNEADRLYNIGELMDMLGIVSTEYTSLCQRLAKEGDEESWFSDTSPFNICRILNLRPEETEDGLKTWEQRIDYESLYNRNKSTRYDSRSNFVQNARQLHFIDQFVLAEKTRAAFKEDRPQRHILVYYCPSRVVRLSMHHVDPYLSMSAYIPFLVHKLKTKNLIRIQYLNDQAATPYFPFPPLAPFEVSSLRQNAKQLLEELERNNPLRLKKFKFSADALRAAYFELDGDNRDQRTLFVSKHDICSLYEIRQRVYEEVVRSIQNKDGLPPAMEVVRDYIRGNESVDSKFTLFPNIFDEDPHSYNFKVYENLTQMGNFDVNFNDRFFEGPAAAVRFMHKEARFLRTMMALSCVLQYGMQGTVLWYGPAKTGKSWLLKFMKEFCLVGLIRREDTKTSQSDNTSTNRASVVCVTDDLGVVGIPFLGRNEDGAFKSERTDGVTVRNVFELAPGNVRITKESESDFRFQRWYFANFDAYKEVGPASITRFYLRPVEYSKRTETVQDQEEMITTINTAKQLKEKYLLRQLMSGFQAFCNLYWYFVRAGAIPYVREKMLRLPKLLHHRLKKAFEYFLGFLPSRFVADRFEKDLLNPIVEACMLEEVYVAICSGSLQTIARPGAPLDLSIFSTLAYRGIFVASQQSYIRAISHFEDDFQMDELKALLLFFWRRHGSNDQYEPTRLSGYQKTPFYLRTASDANTTELPSEPDYNYLVVCSQLSFPANMAIWAEKQFIADAVLVDFPTVSKARLLETMDLLFTTRRRVKSLGVKRGSQRVYGSAAHVNLVPVTTGAYAQRQLDGMFDVNTETVEEMGEEELPIMQRHAGAKDNVYGKYVPKYVILREYFDHMYSLPFGWFQQPSSPSSHEGHRSTTLENILPFVCYEGAPTQTVVLPGMVLDRPVELPKPDPIQPHIPEKRRTREVFSIESIPEETRAAPSEPPLQKKVFKRAPEMPHIMKVFKLREPEWQSGTIPGLDRQLSFVEGDRECVQWEKPSPLPNYYLGDISEKIYLDILEEYGKEHYTVKGELVGGTQVAAQAKRDFVQKVTKDLYCLDYAPLGLETTYDTLVHHDRRLLYPQAAIGRYMKGKRPGERVTLKKSSLPLFEEEMEVD